MRRRKVITAAHAEQLRAELEGRKPKLADVIERNIGIIELLRQEELNQRTRQDRIADSITAFSGSMPFLYLHIVWFGVWIAINLSWIPGVKAFDPYPFGLLTMIVSLEAIFLSTFVMISQNRQSSQGDEQRLLDLQIDLLAEYEITRMLRLVDRMAEKMEIKEADDTELDQLCEPVAPDIVLREIEARQKGKA